MTYVRPSVRPPPYARQADVFAAAQVPRPTVLQALIACFTLYFVVYMQYNSHISYLKFLEFSWSILQTYTGSTKS